MSDSLMKHRNGNVSLKAKLVRSSVVSSLNKYGRKRIKDVDQIKCVCISQRCGTLKYPQIWSDFRLNNQLCDGTIFCDDGIEIKIHRVILASVSSYFKAHFTNSLNGGFPENSEARVNVPSNIFMKILNYAYSGFCNIESNTVEALLRAADQYHVLGIIQLCCNYILDQLQPTNCLGILRFARHYFCYELEEKGRRYVRRNFVKLLSEGEEFEKLDVNEVIDLLKDDELNVKSEELVCEAVKKWISFDIVQRKLHLLTLLKCVRLGTLTNDFLTTNVMKWNLISDSEESQQYLMHISDIIDSCKNQTTDYNNCLIKPRIPYDILFAVGGWSAGSPTNFIETYDTRADKWLLCMDTDSVPRAYHGLCALNGCLYMIGGFDGNEHFNTVRCFDPVEHKWTECACMYYPRCYVSVVMHDNKIYAMGGYNGRMRMSSAERYDPKINQWELIKPMQRQRSDASAAVLSDKIYIVGGFNGHEVMSSAEVYDIYSNQWTFIPHMLSARSGVSLISFKNTIYAIGGFNGFTRLTTGEKLTPGLSTGWGDISEMFSPRSNFATVILDDLIFVIGGFNGSTTINSVECYDTDANEWFDAAPMNLNRSALSACVLSGLPNARDYSYIGKNHTEVGQGAGGYEEITVT